MEPPEREQLEVDVLFVGAGPANLASALHLSRLLREGSSEGGPSPDELTILVIEKGKEIGSHILSGAVVNPRGFEELLQGFPGKTPPYDCPVADDAALFLTEKSSRRLPLTPPPLRNHGNFVASLGKLVRWMAELAEEHGIEVYPEFPGAELLFEEQRVVGVRIGDRGVDKDGNPKDNYEPGIEVRARVTVLGEGVRGSLTKQAVAHLNLDSDSQPQIYAVGVKEIWKTPRQIQPGTVYHTLGFPLGTSEFGGGFIYTMKENLIDLGFVVGLDYSSPGLDPHALLQQFKGHPFVRELLKGGQAVSYGAKAIPEGGYYSMPRTSADGLLIVGDSAGFLDAQKLKGVHLAIKSGMLAAETIYEGLKNDDFSAERLHSYKTRFENSWAREQLWGVRNFRQSFQKGFWRGMLHAGLQFVSNGRGLRDPMPTRAGYEMMEPLSRSGKEEDTPEYDGDLTFDKLTDIFLSDTAHEEDQPCHLRIQDFDICHDRCTAEYGNPCQHFCPANVYEMMDGADGKRLQVNFTNCVHCKTCDIMDPYQIIEWTTPEGGGGPDWKNM